MIVIIMAGGMGKRMESDLPKVLHQVTHPNLKDTKYPMLIHVIMTSLNLTPKKIFIIVGKFREIISNQINNYINFCIKSHNEINKYEDICHMLNESINNKDDISNEIINNPIIKTIINNKQKVSSSMKFYLLKKKFQKQQMQSIIENYLTYDEVIF